MFELFPRRRITRARTAREITEAATQTVERAWLSALPDWRHQLHEDIDSGR